jgi:hypothetical protein
MPRIMSNLILVNNQLDTQFFIYVYFYSLHVLGSHVPISPSSGELLYQCDTWSMSLCIDDHLVCRSMFLFSTCFGQPHAHHQENYCISVTPGLCHCEVDRLVCRSMFLFSTCFGQPRAHHQENYCIGVTPGLCHSV